jgi:integrase
LTDRSIAALKPRVRSYSTPDPLQPNLYIRVWPSGVKSFVAVANDPTGKQRWVSLGTTKDIDIAQAREKCREVVPLVKAGRQTRPESKETFGEVTEAWLREHKRQGFTTAGSTEARLRNYVLPIFGNRILEQITNSEVHVLRKAIADGDLPRRKNAPPLKGGPRQAQLVHGLIKQIIESYEASHDSYRSVVKKTKDSTSRVRERVLSEQELRALWEATESFGMFGAFVRMALLTAQRRETVAGMKWDDISTDFVWSIPKGAGPRPKTNGGRLALPPLAQGVLAGIHRYGENPYVFAGRGLGHINSMSGAKRRLDARLLRLAPQMKPWCVHDLRRTACTLMSNADVHEKDSERALGHALVGVKRRYNLSEHGPQKARALAALSDEVARIVGLNIRPLKVA